MKLYSFPLSTTSRPILLFVAESKVLLDIEHVDLRARQHLSADYLAVNPNGLVPYLVDGEVKLGESTAILRYLADKVDSPAYPRDLAARAKVDEALGWFSTQFHAHFCLFTVYPQLGIPHDLSPAFSEALVAYGTAHVPRWLTVLDRQMLAGDAFVCGDDITIADHLGVAFVTLGEATNFDFSPYPNIQRWVGRMKALAGWDWACGPFEAELAARRSARQMAD